MITDLALKDDLLNTDLLFAQLWEISVDGMRLIDDDGNILLVNDAFCKIFGMSKNDLIGKPFTIVYTTSEQESALKAYQIDIRNDELKTLFERENTLWNGRKAWFEFSNSFLTLPDEKKITLSVIKEITSRKSSEIELRESEHKFKMLFNNANDAVFVTQLSEDKTYGDFIEVNDIACNRLGYTKDEFLNLSPSAIVSPKSIDDYTFYSNKLMEHGHVIYEITHKAKDKKLIPVEINSHLFLFKDKRTVLSIARDITERKRVEEKLRQSSKLLRELSTHLQSVREDERTTIAREIHDELGQVLTALKIHISLLGNKLNKNQLELLERINTLNNLVDNLVESVQKISSKLRPGILDELGLFAAIEWQTEEFEKLTGIKCALVLPTQEPELDNQRSTAIFRILQEALTNITRHSSANKVNISLLFNFSNIILEIKDNGKGITNEQIKDFRSLGIHGMEERAMVLGGQFLIEGLAGRGTVLKVEIPLEKQNE